MFNRRSLCVSIVAAALTACAAVPASVSVADSIANNPSLNTLNGLLDKAGLTSALRGTGPFTVFAPNDDAFKLLSPKAMDDLTKHPEKLREVLSFHVVAEKLAATNIKNSSVKTLNGAPLALARSGDFVTVESAIVKTADIQATNGVVHVIDSVLTPAQKK